METTFSLQRKATVGNRKGNNLWKMVPKGFNACRAILGGHKLMVDIARSKGI